MLARLMTVDFCCNIWILGSEFGINHMKEPIISLCQGVGVIFLVHFGSLVEN